MPISDIVPLMYQAQVAGRCQLQRIVPNANKQDAEEWVDQWIDRTYPQRPLWGSQTQLRRYSFPWRLVTNGGQDDGVIRPVIGAHGWPFYPGSSMKGVFRRACTPEQRSRYCGRDLGDGDIAPGILRFLGGYPIDTSWTKGLIDLVHPQQEWQLNGGNHSAFIQMSLYQPTLEFAISCTETLSEDEWKTIWAIWEKAITAGLGCRVSAGYGQLNKKGEAEKTICTFQLKGQGPASQLLEGDPEFRPNMFKAALRGHAMRIFGGLTDAAATEMIVKRLFGGLNAGDPDVGLVAMRFRPSRSGDPPEPMIKLSLHGSRNQQAPYYKAEGYVDWLLNRPNLDPQVDYELLKKLILKFMQFAMIFGGFGKSWRRADHRLFFADNTDYERLIGCHWQWGDQSLRASLVSRPQDIPLFIEKVQDAARTWIQSQGIHAHAGRAGWREVWHPEQVQVWARIAEDQEDSLAINWLHKDYQNGKSIKQSTLTGKALLTSWC